MVSRIDPALDRRVYFFIFTGTVNGFVKTDDLFLQTCNGHDRLEGRARRFLGLGRIVVQRQGQILLQLSHISRIRASGQAVIVVARIGNQCPHLSGVDIRDHNSAGTRVKGQLSRCQFNVLDLAADKLEGVFFAIGSQKLHFVCVVRKHPLGVKCQAQLTSGDNLVIDQITVNTLGEFCVILQMLQHVVHQNLVDIIGTGILVGDIQLCGIDPAFRNTGVNIITQTDLVILPRLIALAVLVDLVFLDDPDCRI